MARVLLDNENYRLTLGFFGRYTATLKWRNLSRKLTREEGKHFMRTVECLADLGAKIEPGEEAFDDLCSEFVDAIFTGEAKWLRVYQSPPHEVAEWFI